MARIDRPQLPRTFSFGNDPKDPCIVYWGMATVSQWDVYERRMLAIAGPPVKNRKPTEAQTAAGAAATREFCLARISDVKGFVVDDGKGGDKVLTWPADKDAITAAILENPALTGGLDLYIRTVIQSHRPPDEAFLAAQFDGEEATPGN